jgi:hypothetical protein
MVWFEYVLDALHGDPTEDTSSPKTPNTPSTPTIDPRKFLNEEDAIDLYDFMKKTVYDACYEGCLLNDSFNSFSLHDMINTRRFTEKIECFEHYRAWLYTYKPAVRMLYDYAHTVLRVWGKRIEIPEKLFQRFVYYYSDGFITQS